MAKISARGAHEVCRWEKGGAALVLTSDGRLLERLHRGGNYAARKAKGARKWTEQTAGAQAAVLGYIYVGVGPRRRAR